MAKGKFFNGSNVNSLAGRIEVSYIFDLKNSKKSKKRTMVIQRTNTLNILYSKIEQNHEMVFGQ